jgi:hypothetical protein
MGRHLRRSEATFVPAIAAAALISALLAGGAASAPKPPTILATFTTPGTYAWVVPDKVKLVTFDVFGAEGGSTVDDSTVPGTIIALGGRGGEALATFPVTAGQTIQIVVGGRGGDSSGVTQGTGGSNGGGNGNDGGIYSGSNRPTTVFYGGAGGGGASDVRMGPCANSLTCALADRVVVGGGGGGAGGEPTEAPATGGAGGGPSGGTGVGDGAGRGGTQQAGGDCLFPGGTNPGTSGSFGQGGGGNGAGGGGGGGWYGGAGGCTSGIPPSDGQGSAGGGGSGLISPSDKKVTGSFPGGTSNTNGSVIITTP